MGQLPRQGWENSGGWVALGRAPVVPEAPAGWSMVLGLAPGSVQTRDFRLREGRGGRRPWQSSSCSFPLRGSLV